MSLQDFPELLSPGEAGKAIGIATRTLAIWRSTGRYNLPYLKSGQKVFYKKTDLLAFIERRTVSHTGEAAA
jgi:hypothetical protein